MPTYYDTQNQPHVLNKRLGSGGEGAVYSCDDDFRLVAKIYHEPPTGEKAEKLRWMAAHQDEKLNKVAAWVLDVLTDAPGGKVVGFLMPNVRAKEIHELYSLKSRRVYFPEATWHFLIHAAANLARAFYSLHKNGHVMGDINHGNCVVLADGTVKLIDCDSYSVKTEKTRYPCEVGVATHLAPELQGVNLRGVEREFNHDNFGLAVIIFQLLFLGRHPFAGNFLGGEDKPIEDCIREHLFAYGKGAKRKKVAQPPGTLSLSAVSPRVAELFKRAFTSDDNRPAPREWIEALEDLADSLEQCSLHPGHLFYEKTALCPWCEIEAETGVMLFPIVTTSSSLKSQYQKPFDITTIENLVESFNIKPNLPVKLSENVRLKAVPAVPEVIQANKKHRNQNVFVCTTYFICLFAVYLVAGESGCGGCVFFLSIVATCVLYNLYKDSGNTVSGAERERLFELQYKWDSFENEWKKVAASPVVERDLTQIKEKIEDYRALPSAASIDEPPIVSEKANDDEPNQTLADGDHAGKRRRLELEIGALLVALRAHSVRLKGQRQNVLAQSRKLARALAQSQSNVASLGNNIPIGVFLIFITVLTPILDFAVPALNVRQTTRQQSYPTPYFNGNVASYTQEDVEIPDERITDHEIARLTTAEKSKIIRELFRFSDMSLADKDYQGAEWNLKFALRFDTTNITTLNKLGSFYYDQKKFAQALTYYERSKKADGNQEVDFFIGMTYLNLQNYEKAKDIFVKTINSGTRTNESFYNLGMAHQGLGDHKAALDAFNEALDFKPNDVDSMYQIGISLNKLGYKDGVRRYYRMIKDINKNRAADFKKAVGKSVNFDVPPEGYTIVGEDAPPTITGANGVGSGSGVGPGGGGR